MKFTMKKFQLVRKYANYPTWDEKQNAPSQIYIFFIVRMKFNLKSHNKLSTIQKQIIIF